MPFEPSIALVSNGSRAAIPAHLGAAAQEDRHLVAEPLAEPRFDPLGQRALALPVSGAEDDVAAGAEGRHLGEAQGLELGAQLLVLDPALAEVHPAQEGDIALHAGSLRFRRGPSAHLTRPVGTGELDGGAEIRTRIRGRGAKVSTGLAGALFSSPGVRAGGHYGRHSPLKFPLEDGAIRRGEPAF